MRTVVHLSDLHFGKVDQDLLAPLVKTVNALAPEVVVVSGDLTQRARTAQFAQVGKEVIKVVVTHHPFDVPSHIDAGERVGRAEMAMAVFAQCGVDLLQAGHLHTSRIAGTGDRYALSGYEALVVSAGTATSTRGRGETKSFNLLRLQKQRIEVERYEWVIEDRRFAPVSRETFERKLKGWTPVARMSLGIT